MLDNSIDRNILDEYGLTLLHDQGGSPKDGIWIFNEYPDFYVYIDSNGQYRSGLDGDDSIHATLRDALDHVKNEFYEEFGDEIAQLTWQDTYDNREEFVSAIYHMAYGESGFTRVVSTQPVDDFWISNYTPTAIITRISPNQYVLNAHGQNSSHNSLDEAMAVANRWYREYGSASSPSDITNISRYAMLDNDVLANISTDRRVGIPSMDITMRRGVQLSIPDELLTPDARGGRMIRPRRRTNGNGGQVNVEFRQ